jgi:hypothetical protein
MDSDDADEENKSENGKTLLYVFERGYYTFCKKLIVVLAVLFMNLNVKYYYQRSAIKSGISIT